MLEEIMAWLTGAEATLTAAEALPDPKDIPNIKTLLDDHRYVECLLRGASWLLACPTTLFTSITGSEIENAIKLSSLSPCAS